MPSGCRTALLEGVEAERRPEERRLAGSAMFYEPCARSRPCERGAGPRGVARPRRAAPARSRRLTASGAPTRQRPSMPRRALATPTRRRDAHDRGDDHRTDRSPTAAACCGSQHHRVGRISFAGGLQVPPHVDADTPFAKARPRSVMLAMASTSAAGSVRRRSARTQSTMDATALPDRRKYSQRLDSEAVAVCANRRVARAASGRRRVRGAAPVRTRSPLPATASGESPAVARAPRALLDIRQRVRVQMPAPPS